jgi:hypothetical protein
MMMHNTREGEVETIFLTIKEERTMILITNEDETT